MKWLNWLLVLVPVALFLEYSDTGGTSVLFIVSALALIPLAAVLGSATEEVAEFTGPRIGGLLNATLGNAAELIITVIALREGLDILVKASIAGSIIGNLLIVLGASLLLGGLRHGEQRFDARIASVNATIMMLAVVAMLIPAIFEIGSEEHHPTSDDIVLLSDGTAAILIVLYGLYLYYTIFAKHPSTASTVESNAGHVRNPKRLPLALGILVASTIAIVFMSELLVGSLEPTAEAWGMSELFVGVMLVPLVGNIAEHLVAVQVALRNKMDLSIGIAVGSGLQIALFVAPVLVLVSRFVGPEPITLVFSTFELAALVGAVLITVLISVDGRTNWLEGAQLIGLYFILGLAFYVI